MDSTKPLTCVATYVNITTSHIERGIMDEQELVSLLRDYGWTFTLRNRRTQGKQYIYARKRQGTEIIECYLAPLSKLHKLTPAFIIEKLENASPKTHKADIPPLLQNLRMSA